LNTPGMFIALLHIIYCSSFIGDGFKNRAL